MFKDLLFSFLLFISAIFSIAIGVSVVSYISEVINLIFPS